MELYEVKRIAKECIAEMNSIGITVPTGIKYRVSGRMTRALGNCAEKRSRLTGELMELTITISRDLPLSVGKDTVMHELIHAVVGARARHGWQFQQMAQRINRQLGYNIGTYANEEEATAIRAVRAERIQIIGTTNLVCAKCGKVHTVKANSKYARMYKNYYCKCGGSLSIQ